MSNDNSTPASKNETELPSAAMSAAQAPQYHPGITPGIDFIWGSDQDEYKEQAPTQENNES